MEITIRKVGNGAFLPLTQAVLRSLGQAVRLTVQGGVLTLAPADGAYTRTRKADPLALPLIPHFRCRSRSIATCSTRATVSRSASMSQCKIR